MKITTVGVDRAKTSFQVHGLDLPRHIVVRKQLRCADTRRFFTKLRPCVAGLWVTASLGLRTHDARTHRAPDYLAARSTLRKTTRPMGRMPKQSGGRWIKRTSALHQSRRKRNRRCFHRIGHAPGRSNRVPHWPSIKAAKSSPRHRFSGSRWRVSNACFRIITADQVLNMCPGRRPPSRKVSKGSNP